MVIAISGATGFVGRRLIETWPNKDDRFIALGRRPANLGPRTSFSQWNPMQGEPEPDVMEQSNAVIHLAGEPVSQRWNAEVKCRIRDSRVIGTRNLVNAIARTTRRPAVLVSASAVGYYGERGDSLLEESAPPATGYLAEVCKEWEAEADKAESLGVRVVKIRIGLVLGRNGGALAKMLLPFRLGLGAKLGNGRQWMSWIHIDDLTGMIRHAVTNPAARGVWNGVAPNPVTNADFTCQLGRAVHRPAIFAAPRFVIELGAGEMSQILFFSQRCVPKAPLAAGYEFRYPQLGSALADVVS